MPFMIKPGLTESYVKDMFFLWLYGSFYCFFLLLYLARLRVHEGRLLNAHISFTAHRWYKVLRVLSATVAFCYFAILFLFFVIQVSPLGSKTNHLIVQLSRYCQLISSILLLVVLVFRRLSYTISPYGRVSSVSMHSEAHPGPSEVADSEQEEGRRQGADAPCRDDPVSPEIADSAVTTLFVVSALFGIVTSVPAVTISRQYMALVAYSILARLLELIAVTLALMGLVRITGEKRRRLLTRLQEIESMRVARPSFESTRSHPSSLRHGSDNNAEDATSFVRVRSPIMSNASGGSSVVSSIASSHVSSVELSKKEVVKTRTVEV